MKNCPNCSNTYPYEYLRYVSIISLQFNNGSILSVLHGVCYDCYTIRSNILQLNSITIVSAGKKLKETDDE